MERLYTESEVEDIAVKNYQTGFIRGFMRSGLSTHDLQCVIRERGWGDPPFFEKRLQEMRDMIEADRRLWKIEQSLGKTE